MQGDLAIQARKCRSGDVVDGSADDKPDDELLDGAGHPHWVYNDNLNKWQVKLKPLDKWIEGAKRAVVTCEGEVMCNNRHLVPNTKD